MALARRELEALLAALREAKLPVGVAEELRLRRLLALEARLDRRRLERLVACVAVRSKTHAEVLDRIFDAWFEQAEAAVARELDAGANAGEHTPGAARSKPSPWATPPPPDVPRPTPGARPWRPWRRWLLRALAAIAVAAAVTAAVIVILPRLEPRPIPASTGVARAVAALVPPSVHPGGAGFALVPSVRLDLDVTPPPPSRRWAELGAAAVALAIAAGLWLGLRKRSYLPKPEPAPSRPGPPDVPLSPPALRGPVLLDAAGRDALVWGVERLVSDDATAALDVRRSVRATAAAAGIPSLCFQRAGRYRTAWLWIDEAAQDPMIARLAAEVEAALAQAGLPVERATYWAVPDRLATADGAEVAPHELEERQAGAAVALLTDGRALSIRYAAGDQRRRIDALLRALSRWPRLSFADFGEGRHGLDAIAGAHEIPVVRPEALARFLAEGAEAPAGERPGGVALAGDALAWAAACALSPRPVDEATAFVLRDALELGVTPWTMAALRREGAGTGALLAWPPAKRAWLLRWLASADRDVGADDAAPVPKQSLLGRALKVWRERYEQEDAARATAEGYAATAAPWRGTPAERQLRVEQALLDLWDRPDDAAAALYALSASDAGGGIRRALERCAAMDMELEKTGDAAGAAVVLPWRMARRRAEARVMLQELGFGAALGPRRREALRRPGRLGLAIGLAGGLALGAGVAAVRWTMAAPEAPRCEVPAGDAEARCDVEPAGGEMFKVTARRGEARPVEAEVEGGARVTVAVREVFEVAAAGTAPPPEATCPEGMVPIPGGTFLMGSPDGEGEENEHPQHPVRLDAYCMDRTEVTVAAYRRCVDEKTCTEPDKAGLCNWGEADRDQHPVNCVDWTQADTYCRWRGTRLPTEAEWEYAAKGPDAFRYPWGNSPPGKQLCWDGEGSDVGKGNRQSTCTISAYPEGASPFGLMDMAGNVWEWCQDRYGVYEKTTDPVINQSGPKEGPARVLRGGSWLRGGPSWVRAASRDGYDVSRRDYVVGFRCARGQKK